MFKMQNISTTIFLTEKQNVGQSDRVVAKKIVSWIRFSLSQSPLFARYLEQNFIPNFVQQLECGGYQASCLDTVDTRTEYMLNMCSKQDFIPVTFTCFDSQEFVPNFHLHVDSSIWFRYQMIVGA